jgi:hypothetical protein
MLHLERNRSALALTVLAIGMCNSVQVLAAERHTTAQAEVIHTDEPPTSEYDEDFASSGGVTSFVDPSAGFAYCIAGSGAGYKKVKAIAIADDHGPLNGAGIAITTARSTDKVTFETGQARPGETVTVQAVLNIDGLITGSVSCPFGQSYWHAGGTLTLYYGRTGANFIAHEAYGFIDNDPESENSVFENGEVIVNLELENGVEYQLIMEALAYATVSTPGECTGNAKGDMGNTFTWMGLVGAADSKGNPITEYTLVDEFGNDWTTPPSVADINIDGAVDVDDLLAVINGWGACGDPCPPSCAADIAPLKGDCVVDVDDLLLVINSWGT